MRVGEGEDGLARGRTVQRENTTGWREGRTGKRENRTGWREGRTGKRENRTGCRGGGRVGEGGKNKTGSEEGGLGEGRRVVDGGGVGVGEVI